MFPPSTSHTASAAPATASQAPYVSQRKHKRTARTTAPYQRSPSSGNSPSASGSPSSASAESPSSSHTPPSNTVRWPCRLSGCSKSYTRPYDLIRHLVASHPSCVASASEEDIMAAGVPRDLVYRVHELLERSNRCERCGKAFSRRDALVRHVIEQKHGLTAPTPNAAGVLEPMISVDEFLSRLGLGPAKATPALGAQGDFCGDALALFGTVPSITANEDAWSFLPGPIPSLDLPSLDDWETLIAAWAASHEGS